MPSKPVTFHDVTDQLCSGILAEAERLYANGANALVNAEIALVRQSIYHKPSFNPDWSWQPRRYDSRTEMGDFADDDPADFVCDDYDPPDLLNPGGVVRHGDYGWDLLADLRAADWEGELNVDETVPERKRLK